MAGYFAMRQVLKQIMPAPLIRLARAGETISSRLSIWLDVARSVRGRTRADKLALRYALVSAPIDVWRDLSRWRNPKLSEDADLEVKGLGLFTIRGNSDDLAHVLPAGFTDVFAAAAAHLRPGDTAIDAGSNIGAVSIRMATLVGPSGHVIAIEMMPDTAKLLRRNIALNKLDYVSVVEKALSDRAGETVAATVEPGLYGQASIVSGLRGDRCKIGVETTTLDQVTEDIGEIALMKMDLEGAEPQALRGASSTLRKTRSIVFESWSQDGGDTAQMLRAAGFTIAPLDGRNFLAIRGTRAI